MSSAQRSDPSSCPSPTHAIRHVATSSEGEETAAEADRATRASSLLGEPTRRSTTSPDGLRPTDTSTDETSHTAPGEHGSTAPGEHGGVPAAPDFPELAHRRILQIVGALVLCLFVSSLSATVVGTALPTIVGDLGGQEQLPWVVSATLLTTTVSTPLWGKLSDLYGRKPLMQVAILVFVGSSLFAGLAQSMEQLIAARAVQGVGAGGVMAMAQAILADIVSPRERGRYSGYLGSAFGLATVAGPLIGGFLVDGPGWRWCFYVGIPIAVLASVVLHRILTLPLPRREARIDWYGAMLITAAASAVLLLFSLGGQQFRWISGWTALLVLLALSTLIAAIFVERRAAEPILPPRLFANPTFNLTSIASFLVGFALFGAMVYLPQYLQIVRGKSPTVSGLLTLPLIFGMLGTGLLCGKAITRWGRWKIYPLVGMVCIAAAASLLSTLTPQTNLLFACLYMAVFGVGLGLTMQVLVLAVQNSVDRADLGVATSSSFFFRTMGGAIGVSLFGAVLSARLQSALPQLLRKHDAKLPSNGLVSDQLGTPREVALLPEPFRSVVREGFALGIDRIYILVVPLVLLSFVALLLVKEVPLKSDSDTADPTT